jgi:hypothetical protein
MAGKDIAVKKYVVRLSTEEREQLQALVSQGQRPGRRRLAKLWARRQLSVFWCRARVTRPRHLTMPRQTPFARRRND